MFLDGPTSPENGLEEFGRHEQCIAFEWTGVASAKRREGRMKVENVDNFTREPDAQRHNYRLIFSRNELIELLFPACTAYTTDG